MQQEEAGLTFGGDGKLSASVAVLAATLDLVALTGTPWGTAGSAAGFALVLQHIVGGRLRDT